jgi:hypothetical protein
MPLTRKGCSALKFIILVRTIGLIAMNLSCYLLILQNILLLRKGLGG